MMAVPMRRSRLARGLLVLIGLLLCPGLAGADSSLSAAPVKLAVFEFELEDYSAGAAPTGETPADAKLLAGVTSDVRNLLAQSGRYRLVDVAEADTAAATARHLHECDGCDAPIALKLGAEQSFVGVVKRISRMEYTVRFQIRDAHTGAVVSNEESGLRMGADYSWSRGAAELVKDRLLASGVQQ
jgi:hypothetical protein